MTDQMMCAADIDGDSLTEDSRYGDSGGPLILTDPSVASRNKDVQVGIVSFGSKTCGKYPGVYTRVSSVLQFQEHLKFTPPIRKLTHPLSKTFLKTTPY